MRKCVFLDRDGVLNYTKVENGKPFAPTSFADFKLYENINGPLESLKKMNFLLFVVTNQPDVGNQKVARGEVEAMHDYLLARTPVDAVFACFHSQDEDCSCRKPEPGMLYAAAFQYFVMPSLSYIVGDRYSDIVAGNKFGCQSILIDRSYKECRLATPWRKVGSLLEAVKEITVNEQKDKGLAIPCN